MADQKMTPEATGTISWKRRLFVRLILVAVPVAKLFYRSVKPLFIGARESVPIPGIIGQVMLEELRSADREVFNETFFEAVNKRRDQAYQEERLASRWMYVSLIGALFFGLKIATKFAAFGIDVDAKNATLVLTLSFFFFDLKCYLSKVRNIPVDALLEARSYIVTKGRRSRIYSMRHGYRSVFGQDILKGSRILEIKSFPMFVLATLRPRFAVLAIASVSVIFSLLFILMIAIAQEVLIIILCFESVAYSDMPIYLSLPVVFVGLISHILLRGFLIALLHGFAKKPLTQDESKALRERLKAYMASLA